VGVLAEIGVEGRVDHCVWICVHWSVCAYEYVKFSVGLCHGFKFLFSRSQAASILFRDTKNRLGNHPKKAEINIEGVGEGLCHAPLVNAVFR